LGLIGRLVTSNSTFQELLSFSNRFLLIDIMAGDATLFMRADQVEASWSILTPILNEWSNATPVDFPNYQSGTWGPKAAEVLMMNDELTWQ